MSLWRRIARVYETSQQQHLDGRAAFGELGEESAAHIISKANVTCCLRNPILPVGGAMNRTLESDFLVYTHGTLFCIEVKNYKGRLWYANHSVTGKQVLMQEKYGAYGERFLPQEQRDPLRQVGTFIHHLKRTLVSMDQRFRHLYIIAVAAFTPASDMTAIRSFQEGIVSITDLPAFFEARANMQGANTLPAPWILATLHRLPRADVIVTTAYERFKGFLLDQELCVQNTTGQMSIVPYSTTHSVSFQRTGLFSAYDTLTITSTTGQQQSLHAVKGSVRFQTLDGRQHIHYLRNIHLIEVGKTASM